MMQGVHERVEERPEFWVRGRHVLKLVEVDLDLQKALADGNLV